MTAWNIDRRQARLQLAHLAATIDLAAPDRGLVGLRVENDCLDGAALLGVDIPSFGAREAKSLRECRVRGWFLTARYQAVDDWPIELEATWRAESASSSDARLAMLTLVISVETQRLAARPALAVASVLPSADAFRLVDARSPRFEPVGSELPCVVEPSAGPGCVLFRFAGSDLSYAEMVHPLDFLDSRLESCAGPRPMLRLRHRLFGGPLEKGVILRARVCGLLLRRADDARIAAETYAGFATAEPPLGA